MEGTITISISLLFTILYVAVVIYCFIAIRAVLKERKRKVAVKFVKVDLRHYPPTTNVRTVTATLDEDVESIFKDLGIDLNELKSSGPKEVWINGELKVHLG